MVVRNRITVQKLAGRRRLIPKNRARANDAVMTTHVWGHYNSSDNL